MKLTELIAELEKIKETTGDVEVTMKMSGFGGYGVYTISKVNKSSIHTSELDENFDSDIAESFFPSCKGEHEILEEMDEEVVCVELSDGSLIYAT